MTSISAIGTTLVISLIAAAFDFAFSTSLTLMNVSNMDMIIVLNHNLPQLVRVSSSQ